MTQEASYPAAEVDPIIGGLMDLLDQTLAVAKSAEARAVASEAQVELQKVAAQPTPAVVLDERLLKQAAQALVDAEYCAPEAMDSLIADIKKDPNLLLKIAVKQTTLLSPAPSQGRGVTKQAAEITTPASDVDGWDKVAKEGAA